MSDGMDVRLAVGQAVADEKTEREARENHLTERAIARWLRESEGCFLNQPSKDYCGVIQRNGKGPRYVHVGNSYHTFAVYLISHDRLIWKQTMPRWVTREVYGA